MKTSFAFETVVRHVYNNGFATDTKNKRRLFLVDRNTPEPQIGPFGALLATSEMKAAKAPISAWTKEQREAVGLAGVSPSVLKELETGYLTASSPQDFANSAKDIAISRGLSWPIGIPTKGW